MIIFVKYFVVHLTILRTKILTFYFTSDPELVYPIYFLLFILLLCMYGVKSHDTSETTTGVSQRSTVGTDLLPT